MPVTTIDVRERVMARNDEIAAVIRQRLRETGTLAFNFISSPGSGKTLFLERTLQALDSEMAIAVVTGDCQTQNDADRLARHTHRLVQAVVTNGACHVDARQVERALESIDIGWIELLLIENVGNLVCPASWDLGEDSKVVLYSVTEGDDKALKYPNTFRRAKQLVITKLDLLPHVDFELHTAVGNALSVNPALEVFYTSARTGEGMEDWFDFLRSRVRERHVAVS
jgi:hydrogenase nickel incorporation protein HypB